MRLEPLCGSQEPRTYLADETGRTEWGSGAKVDLGPARGPGPGLVNGADGEESSCPSLWHCVGNASRWSAVKGLDKGW